MNRKSERKRKKGALWQRVLLALIAVVIGLAVYTLNARRLVGDMMPMPFGVGMSVVLSGSMEPTLSVNDLVIVKAQEDYAVGDVVVYRDSGGLLVIHRIIERSGETVIAQGDANNASDDPFEASQIKGKMVASVPGVGAAVQIIGSPAGVAAILLAAGALFVLSCRKEREADDAEMDEIRAEIARLKNEIIGEEKQE